MERLEKLLSDIINMLEEEYDKVLSEDTEYKQGLECILKSYDDDDTPLGNWTAMIMVFMSVFNRLKEDDDKEKLDKLYSQIPVMSRKYNL
jgi:hypothetical protein